MRPDERLLATLAGRPHDRIPIYTQIPFAMESDGSFRPGAFHGYDDYDDWRRRDNAYWRLVRRMEQECDNFFIWRPPCMESDPYFVPEALTWAAPDRRRAGHADRQHPDARAGDRDAGDDSPARRADRS